jgi:hypothetical protein
MFSYFAKDPYEVVGKSVHKRKYYVYVPLNRLFDRPQNISPPGFNNNSFSNNVTNLRFGSWDPRILQDTMINDTISSSNNSSNNSTPNNSPRNIPFGVGDTNIPFRVRDTNIPFGVGDTNIPSPRGLPK